eukprot:SAG31_NODE_25686_length_456_cov_1.156863_1_plen_20_part_10
MMAQLMRAATLRFVAILAGG